jgi:hypothetical protein
VDAAQALAIARTLRDVKLTAAFLQNLVVSHIANKEVGSALQVRRLCGD